MGIIEFRGGKVMRSKKKKKGFGYYLYAVVVLLLTITNITLAILLLTHVQEIEVKGANYSEKSDIIEWFQEDTLTRNSLYSFWKIKSGSYEMPIYLDDIRLSFRAPWKIQLTVTEKEILAGMLYGDSYLYFNKEGLVMTTSTEPLEGIQIIEGLVIVHNSEEAVVNQFDQLKMLDEDIYIIIEKILAALDDTKLEPDRIVWEENSMNLYFGEICVQLGKTNFDEKMTQLSPILEKEELQGKAGILHMENYSETSNTISFEPNQAETEEDSGDQSSGEDEAGEENIGEENTGEETVNGTDQNEPNIDDGNANEPEESGAEDGNTAEAEPENSDTGEDGSDMENPDDSATEAVE